jgi:hypothetical protein
MPPRRTYLSRDATPFAFQLTRDDDREFHRSGVPGYDANLTARMTTAPAAVNAISSKGRRAAFDMLNIDRHHADWRSVIRALV